jgi:hypothetical protein
VPLGLAANTINQQLAAVRRLAHEAADAGWLSPELAAGIISVKGVKQLGFRAGNWLSAAQSSEVCNVLLGRRHASYTRREIYRELATYLQTEISPFPDELVERLAMNSI